MKKMFIKTDTIFEIDIVQSKKTSHRWIENKQIIKGFFRKKVETIPAGWIFHSHHTPVSTEMLLKSNNRLLLKNDEIWDMPYIIVRYAVGTKNTLYETMYFNTDEEAEQYALDVVKNFPHIIIKQ